MQSRGPMQPGVSSHASGPVKTGASKQGPEPRNRALGGPAGRDPD